MAEAQMTPAQALGLAQHIAERTLRSLETLGLVAQDREDRQPRPLFHVWLRRNRVVLIFDPLALRDIDGVLNRRFLHRLATALSGRRVKSSNSRGVYIQVSYLPPSVNALASQPLDLAHQPSPLHLPIGMTKRGPLWVVLIEVDAALIGGSRRMGKTRLLHGWILALIHGGQVLLFLWDGKGGVEFGRYVGQANVTVLEDLAEGLAQIGQEMARRAELFRRAGVPALPEYNAQAHDRLAPIALVIDEAAAIPDEAQAAVADLVARGGAFGVHPLIATQRPDAQAVQSLIKANLSTRIALPVPAVHDSMVILGRTGAEKLPKVPGRLLLVWGGRLVEAQAFQVELPGPNASKLPQPAVLLTRREMRLVEAARARGGWFRIEEIATDLDESRDWVNAVAKRWEAMGFLTGVQVNERGHRLGRRVTEALLQAVGFGGEAGLAE